MRRFDGFPASRADPETPFATAVAATLFAAVDDMLFLRVTRCARFIEPTDNECEWVRDFEGRLEAVEVMESRCWLVGRAVVGSLRTVMVAIGKKTLNSRCFVQSYEVRARNLNAVKSGCTAPNNSGNVDLEQRSDSGRRSRRRTVARL